MQKTNWLYLLIIFVIAVIFSDGIIWYLNKSTIAYSPLPILRINKSNLADQELKDEIGQMIMVGFRGTDAPENSDIQKVIKDVKIGGVTLFDYDVPSNSFPRNIISPAQTKNLTSELQSYSVTPLFISIDAEGGEINRLKPKYGFLSIPSEEKIGQDLTLQTAEKEASLLAGELKGLGINMNFAPVVDVNINPENPIIGSLGRSFSSDPENVTDQAKVSIQNYLTDGIITVEKHFPGEGSATGNTDLGTVDITGTYKEDEELLPYQELNNDRLLNVVMVGHVMDKNIDSSYPASLSKIFLQGILRNEIGFKGVIISDDMQAAAIASKYNLNDAIIMAINAGCDMLTISNNIPSGYDDNIASEVRDIIFNAVKENKIPEKTITDDYNRILNLKKNFNLIQPLASTSSQTEQVTAASSSESSSILARNFKLLQEPSINFGEALDIANYVSGITGVRPAFLLAISQEELSLEQSDLCYLTNLQTGDGTRESDGKDMPKTMNPQRDVQDFISITKELGIDPLKTLVTCPMNFGWGGAMGPADFIPSTWSLYKNKIEKITGKPADPWNTTDAFLAMGLYMSDSGAASQTYNDEWHAAMVYFSGSPNSGYNFYANGVMTLANKIQKDIDSINKGN